MTVANWRKNSREVLQVQLSEYKGRILVDARAWYGEPDNLRPGRSGLTVAIRHLPQLAAGLAAALEAARAHGFIDSQEGAADG